MRLLLDRAASQGSTDERPRAGAGLLERDAPDLRRPRRLGAAIKS